MLEDLNLISSASSDDQLFGAFLYSNASVVAGLRAAARLAGRARPRRIGGSMGRLRRSDLGGRHPSGVGREPSGSPGLVDPDSGRFLQARRVSKLRGLWTGDPDQLIDRADILDINMLGLAVPFGLLPASDPRLVRIAETILRINGALKGDPNVLSRATFVPDQSGRIGSSERPARGLQSGDPLDGPVPDPIGPGNRAAGTGPCPGHARGHPGPALSTRAHPPIGRTHDRIRPTGVQSRRDGLEITRDDHRYHARSGRSRLRRRRAPFEPQPGPPGVLAQHGMKRSLPCGEVSYQLQRPIGGKVHHLQLKTRLEHPVTLQVALTCPDLKELGPWQARRPRPSPPSSPRPDHLEHVAPGGRERMELDVGMSAASPEPGVRVPGPEARARTRHGRFAHRDPVVGTDPESPQSSPEDNAFLQVMAEEGIAGRDEGRRDGWLLGLVSWTF